jgi:hypothetical protein
LNHFQGYWVRERSVRMYFLSPSQVDSYYLALSLNAGA